MQNSKFWNNASMLYRRPHPSEVGLRNVIFRTSTCPPLSHISCCTSPADVTVHFRHSWPQLRAFGRHYADRHTEGQAEVRRNRKRQRKMIPGTTRTMPRRSSDYCRRLTSVGPAMRCAFWCGRHSPAAGLVNHVLPRYHAVLPVSTRSVAANCTDQSSCFPARGSAAKQSIEASLAAVFY